MLFRNRVLPQGPVRLAQRTPDRGLRERLICEPTRDPRCGPVQDTPQRHVPIRSVVWARLFQKVFVQTPISTGKWIVENGRLTFQIQKSIHRDRANREFDFAVRSISDRDFIFVDYIGRVGQAVKVR